MPALAPAALAISVVLSALGAVVLCVLVVLYGFTPADDEPPGAAVRRLLVARFGHVLAAVCFAATAALIAVVLAQPRAPVVTAADARVPVLTTRLGEQASRLAQVEARLSDLETAMRRAAAAPRRPPAATSIASPPPARPIEPPPAVIWEPRPAPRRPPAGVRRLVGE
jgi:hypothetical protein